jgi:hypothetical protein
MVDFMLLMFDSTSSMNYRVSALVTALVEVTSGVGVCSSPVLLVELCSESMMEVMRRVFLFFVAEKLYWAHNLIKRV